MHMYTYVERMKRCYTYANRLGLQLDNPGIYIYEEYRLYSDPGRVNPIEPSWGLTGFRPGLLVLTGIC